MAKSTVAVRFTGDVANLKSAIGDVDGKMSGLGSKLGSVGALAAGGFAVAGAAVIGFAGKAADTFSKVGGEVLKLQRYTGATAEAASQLRFAGTQAGLGVDDLTKSLGLLSKNIVSGKTEKLGFDLKDATGKALPLNDSLLKIAERFKEMPNGVEKNNLALQLFGKAGAQMIPFLNRGADGIKALEKESDKLGTTLSGKDLQAVKESTANHRLFTAAMQGLQIQIGRYVLPIVEKFVSFLATNMPAAIGFVRKVMEGLQPAFTAVGNVIETVRRGVMDFIGTWQNFQDGTTSAGNFGKIEEAAIRLREAFNAVVEWVQQNWPQIQATIQNVMADIATVIQTYIAVIMAVWNTFGDNVMHAIQRVWPPIKQIIQGVMEEIRGIIDVISGIIHGNWGQVWDGIKLIFAGAWNEMLGLVKLILEQIRLGIALALTAIGAVMSGAWNGIKSATASVWGGIVSTITGAVGSIKSFITGIGSTIWGGLSTGLGGIISGIKAALSAMISFVIRIVNDAIQVWNDIPFHKDIKKIGDPSAGLIASGPHAGQDPHHLASGGFAKARPGGIFANIAEGGQDEIVSPVPMLRSLLAEAFQQNQGSVVVENHWHIDLSSLVATEHQNLVNLLRRELEQITRRNGLAGVGF